MTDKLKCPFCSEEIFVAHETMCVCKNDKCRAWGCAYPKFILTALIDGKKAQDAIQKIKDIVYPALDREFYSELRDDMLDIGRIIVSVEKQGE